MPAGSPIAALEPARPASPLKALSVWGAGLVQSQPPAFPAKMSKLWARPQGSDFGLGAIVRNYQSPAMVNAELPQANLAAGKRGPAGGWEARRAGPRSPTCRNSRARGPGPAARPRWAAALRPRYQSSGASGA